MPKDFATTVRDGVFAPTPPPLSVRGQLLYAAWFDLRVETGDLVCAFMQADPIYLGFGCRSVHDGDRRKFTVKLVIQTCVANTCRFDTCQESVVIFERNS